MDFKAFLDGLPIPILQAPMVGAASPEMAVAVSRAGALGALGAGGLAPADMEPAVAALRAATDRPFGVNLFINPVAAPGADVVDAALERLAPWYAELGAALPAAPNDYAPDFAGQFAALVRAAPPVASFTFGVLTQAQVDALHAAGSYVVGTATTVAEARAWAAVGADGISAQGAEAGGHRGHFLDETEASLVGTMALVATIRDAVEIPVIAAGGIMDGRGVVAGALQGGLENRFMREMRAVEDHVPAYPVQNQLTQPLRAAAAQAGRADMLSLWAGQGVRLAKRGDAGEMVGEWWEEAKAASQALSERTGR